MNANVKARYANGVLTPMEPLDPEEGKVVVSIEDAPQAGRRLASIVAKVKELQKDIPPYVWDGSAHGLGEKQEALPVRPSNGN